MSRIKILDETLTELAVIQIASSAVRYEKLNSDNMLSFSFRVSNGLAAYINDTNVIELDNDYFDIALYKKEQQSDGTLMVSVECEHISYRLNSSDYNVEYFALTGTPTEIFSAILSGTGFSVGTIEFTEQTTFSLQESASRRALLMQFVASLGGEVAFDGFTISILSQRGLASPKALTVGKDLTVISKSVDKRNLDKSGNPTISYACGVFKGAVLALGDVVTLDYDALDIDISLRVVAKSYDPYNPNNVSVEIGNYVNSLEDDLYRIETQAVSKDALMNGCRIGPVYGFEVIRNDKKARAYMNSTNLAFQTGDGGGTIWTDKLYFDVDPDTGTATLVFDGELSATIINAISTLITPNFYAGKANISELTVDQLETETKVQNYLNNDLSDVNYIRITGHVLQFISAVVASNYGASRSNSGEWDMKADNQTDIYYSSISVDDDTGEMSMSGGASMDAWSAFQSGRIYRPINVNSYYKLTGASDLVFVSYDVYTISAISANYEQVKNRDGNLLYWTDNNHTAASAEETDYPVYIYLYNELTKSEMSFENDGTNYVPEIVLGAGSGITSESGKGRIKKALEGMEMSYTTADGDDVGGVYIRDDGFVDVTARRADISVNTTNQQITITPEGDDQTDIVIDYTEVDDVLTMTWPDGKSFSVEVTS
ncbi:phage tail spike protein [Phosphitispora sp. TUW77]|uniref:phage tail spike protein n=1 Tax=Phosphitispora sp. TUW77 TaxID=3152361 RepID=UPI003AB63C2C